MSNFETQMYCGGFKYAILLFLNYTRSFYHTKSEKKLFYGKYFF